MRIAWFLPTTPDTSNPFDDSALLIGELRTAHAIDVITEARAHDFVWQHFLRPWDLCVYELDSTPAHEFVWAYLVNYPGVLRLRSTEVAHLQVPLLASRAVVTSNDATADLLRALYPDAHVRLAPIGIAAAAGVHHGGGSVVTFAVADDRPRAVATVHRALERARALGAQFDLVDAVEACDVLIAPAWPPRYHTPTAVVAAFAGGRTVVTTEMNATAGWPALDPQTWRPRGVAVREPPIAVTVDPRDEEHSLLLAVRRLSSDAAMREQIGIAAREWWAAHATPARAAAAWTGILDEAVHLSAPPRPADWPERFSSDGTSLARELLNELGVSPTDILARS